MAGRFEGTAVIDRPIEEVFAFLADGRNDKKFSPRVQEIEKKTDGPPRVGTVYASTVKDAGMKTKREFKLTEFDPPARIRWTEVSQNMVTVPEGGYDLAAANGSTRVTIFNEFEGHGLGKLIAPWRCAARARTRRPSRKGSSWRSRLPDPVGVRRTRPSAGE